MNERDWFEQASRLAEHKDTRVHRLGTAYLRALHKEKGAKEDMNALMEHVYVPANDLMRSMRNLVEAQVEAQMVRNAIQRGEKLAKGYYELPRSSRQVLDDETPERVGLASSIIDLHTELIRGPEHSTDFASVFASRVRMDAICVLLNHTLDYYYGMGLWEAMRIVEPYKRWLALAQ